MLEDDNQPQESSHLRLRYITAVMFVVALLYVGWIFLSRWQANRDLVAQQSRRQALADAREVEAMGGNNLEIQSFYPSPLVIKRGATGQLCYSVSNAKDVRIDPHVDNVWPSLSRCVDVAPKSDTTYTLTATDAAGHSVTQKTTIHVE